MQKRIYVCQNYSIQVGGEGVAQVWGVAAQVEVEVAQVKAKILKLKV